MDLLGPTSIYGVDPTPLPREFAKDVLQNIVEDGDASANMQEQESLVLDTQIVLFVIPHCIQSSKRAGDI